VQSRDIAWRDAIVITPLVLAIVGLALYPQLPLSRQEATAKASIKPAQLVEHSR
jgi:NADH:ubiquinone oxidoreductase subunit 4 (subunit M)